MNSIDDLVFSLTPEMAGDLKRAIELGKFPDGRIVSKQQRELMLEATIVYDSLKLPEQERTGFIHRTKTASGILDSATDIIPSKDIDHD
ncbi:MAG TPA: DUF1315 domain-containing protein [Gammaproteobacteria bacterium]|nr:DUF1315 domain-containing protein [Gammaproteobacteria bacterium]|tara:strand:- start:99 stop:365 length:267 start_codon:yes stop_codon:yes gene_type:complete